MTGSDHANSGKNVRMSGNAAVAANAIECVKQWRRSPRTPVACPHCGVPGVEIIDRSTRPIAEWYAFRCTACGLDDALSIPMPFHRPLL